MAEEGSGCELEGLEKQLESLLGRYSSEELQADSKPFCSDFCELVEQHASGWQVPLPQLRILEKALHYFARASTFFTSNCDHVLHTLSSLALSVFELLLFFDQKDFHQEPLKHFTVTFQECHLSLARHQNVHLLQVERSVRSGGPWAGPALQAILSESSLPQSEVDVCVSSELPVFFEMRVRYLLSCERVSEALALAKCCSRHPTAGQHLFFLQVYLTWLFKTSQHDRLHKEVADFNGKDAIHIICSLECEEKDEVLLALSRVFLSQQLRRGDMYYLCDLVFVWSKLHNRLNTSKQVLLEESHQLLLSASNVNSIFPFIRAVLQELGEDGLQFCVELCANALGSCRPCDVKTKSLIYKTIAGLLPNDLEVSRACALLVFFLERTVDTYKMVYLLYMHPDQDYHVENSPIRNHIRFETLQVLKKDLCFDPEFWNLIALRSNCLKLLSDKVVSSALEEIMEDKWILSYCTKDPASRSRKSVCQKGSKGAGAKKRHHKEDTDTASKRIKGTGKTRLNDHTVKKKGNQGSPSSEPLRRSFWQLDRLQDNVAAEYGELRRATRLSEKNPAKRRIRKPKWLLEDSGAHGGNNVPRIKKHGLKHQKHSVVRRSESGDLKNNSKHKLSHLTDKKNNGKQKKGFPLDSVKPSAAPQVVLELSLPDNELMGTFTEDSFNRQRGFPQVLFYRPTLKVPASSQPVKPVHGKEVVLRARDAAMFLQQLHCYARRQKGRGSSVNIQGSVSTITRSSVHGSPPKDPQRELSEKPAADVKPGNTSLTPEKVEKSPVSEKVLQAPTSKAVPRKIFSGRELSTKSAAEMKVNNVSTAAKTEVTEVPMLDKVLQAQTISSVKELCEESAVEMKVTIASTASEVTQPLGLEKGCKAEHIKEASKLESKTTPPEVSQTLVTDKIPPVSNAATVSIIGAADQTPSESLEVKPELKLISPQAETSKTPVAQADPTEMLPTVDNSICVVDIADVSLSKAPVPSENDTDGGSMVTPADKDSIKDISALTLVTEVVTELAPEALARDLENHKQPAPQDSSSTGLVVKRKSRVPRKVLKTSSSSGLSAVKEEGFPFIDLETLDESELPETEESKLEFCCTFCNKTFKGSVVIAHAMFHYRRDECMFCGTMFKDDLLAMMHLSDHIEKLKRSKESAAQVNPVSKTKNVSTIKTSSKAKTAGMSSRRHSSERQRRSTDSSQSISLPDSTPSRSRELRSKSVDGRSLHEKKPSKHLNSKTPVQKINGHIIFKKEELGRPKKDAGAKPTKQETSPQRTNDKAESPRLQENQDSTKESRKIVEEKSVERKEKLCCPVKGCAWFTDQSKKRVALLYHALEDHNGEEKVLHLAFRVGDGKCSSCMRVMWSFEHFQHHVERHRLAPRHPCLHQGCAARFKTGIEMRRHTRKHSPLQAVCCLPGCSQLFICLWALNLHEREHYASKSTKAEKNTNEQTRDKHNNTLHGKKQPNHKPKTTANKSVSVKSARKLRGDATHHSSTEKPAESVQKDELKEKKETKDSHVLKNLSNKDTCTQPAGPNLRLRHMLRKVTNTTRSHKVISSALKHNIKVRHKFKKKEVKVDTKGQKRRGRPPKAKVAVHDENTTNAPNSQTVVETTKAEKIESKEEEKSLHVQDVLKITETSINQSKSKINKQMKKTHVKQNKISTAIVAVNGLNQEISTTSADKVRNKVKKRCAATGNGSLTAPSDSKKLKVTETKANAKIVRKKSPVKEPTSASTSPATSISSNSVPANGLNLITAPPNTSGEKTQTVGKSRKPQKRKKEKQDQIRKKVDKKMPKGCKDVSKTSLLKKSKSAEKQASTLAESATAVGDTQTQKGTTEENSIHPNTANKKRKNVQEEGDAEIVKKTCQDPSGASASEEPVNTEEKEVKAEERALKEEETQSSLTSSPGYAPLKNGQAAKEVKQEVLPGYGRRPYVRPPPTAYLDEKYITMPKRRKEPSFSHSPQKSPPPSADLRCSASAETTLCQLLRDLQQRRGSAGSPPAEEVLQPLWIRLRRRGPHFLTSF
ncbi:hypothetical protein OYC64_013843 [Pagothenia borchgrevinki]|uniref:C2H2-type domain-containing protein n=1 Tax=Pagothenia borchgrevinki TaxID=8213 RepID=A0ABD2FW53_PAGBO